MSGTDAGVKSRAAAWFAERNGINRKRTAIAAALLGSVLVVALWVMNQRIQERRAQAPQASDSTAVVPPPEENGPGGERAAWADPREARRLAGDTLPAVPEPGDTSVGGEYVPLGRDVGPGEYGEVSRRETGAGDPAGEAPGALPTPPGDSLDGVPRALTPDELRRAAFLRAVASRQLRAGGHGNGDAGGARDSAAAGAPGWGENAAGNVMPPALRPYGREQAEEDSLAAERAAENVGRGRPQAFRSEEPSRAFVSFASLSARPCNPGERVLPAGYVITATLVTEIISEVPGPVLARIGRDVYDARLRCVLFPAGSLLVGRYPEGLSVGGQRLVIAWEQVRLGDGRTWQLPALPSADRRGGAGVPGRVDRRRRETFETAALLSALGAAIEYATPGGGEAQAAQPGGYPSPPPPRDRAVGAATAPFRGAAERLLERTAEIRPVLRLDAGHPITVIVPRDVDLDRPAPAPADTLPVVPEAPAAARS